MANDPYAEGLVWQRMDGSLGLGTSAEGWDSTMTCFGNVQETKHGIYMFYKGNNFGETGFGVAILRP